MKWIIVAAFAVGTITNAVKLVGTFKEWVKWDRNIPGATYMKSVFGKQRGFHIMGLLWDLTWTCLVISLLP